MKKPFLFSINRLRLSEMKCKNGQCPKDIEGIIIIRTGEKNHLLISCFCEEHEKEVEDIIKNN